MSNQNGKDVAGTVRVLLVDDHSVVRFGIRYSLQDRPRFKIVGEAADYATARAAVVALQPDLIIQDLMLAGHGGVDLIREWLDLSPASRVLVLSQHPESVFAERALRAGARGYVMKSEDATELLAAIEVVADGEFYLSHDMNQSLLRSFGQRPGAPAPDSAPEGALSDREQHIFLLLGQGLSTGDLARKLNVSVKTIGAHRENIKARLGLRDAAQLEAAARSFALRRETA